MLAVSLTAHDFFNLFEARDRPRDRDEPDEQAGGDSSVSWLEFVPGHGTRWAEASGSLRRLSVVPVPETPEELKRSQTRR